MGRGETRKGKLGYVSVWGRRKCMVGKKRKLHVGEALWRRMLRGKEGKPYNREGMVGEGEKRMGRGKGEKLRWGDLIKEDVRGGEKCE